MNLDEIRDAAAKATPGPWRATSHWSFQSPGGPDLCKQRDIEFIALSREAVPWLVERCEALEAALTHYASEHVWEDDEGFWYFGRGVSADEPWTVARAALARLEGGET